MFIEIVGFDFTQQACELSKLNPKTIESFLEEHNRECYVVGLKLFELLRIFEIFSLQIDDVIRHQIRRILQKTCVEKLVRICSI